MNESSYLHEVQKLENKEGNGKIFLEPLQPSIMSHSDKSLPHIPEILLDSGMRNGPRQLSATSICGPIMEIETRDMASSNRILHAIVRVRYQDAPRMYRKATSTLSVFTTFL